MNILLLGYGKMGKTIEKIAAHRGHTIVGKIDETNQDTLHNFDSTNTDVAIEFSQPSAAYENIKYCINNGIPAVSGTTGWLDKKGDIEELCKIKNGAFFYASNFSVGVNLFFKLNQQLARLMAPFNEYDIELEEIHHTQKKDAPSGTAITLAEGIINNNDSKGEWELDKKSEESHIPIFAKRIDDVPGTHTIAYKSDVDDIEITHTAHSRQGFAQGAVMVAEWIKNRKGVLSMDDFLKL